MADLASQFKSPSFLLKWVELLLAIVSIAVLRDARVFPSSDMDKIAVSYMALCGFILINLVIVIGFFKDEQLPGTVMLLFLVSGGVLWITAGSFMIEHYNDQLVSSSSRDKLLASGIVALVNGVVYLVDVFFTRRNG